MKRASIKHAIEWIAENDEPEELDEELVKGQITVLLIADIFGKERIDIANKIVKYRYQMLKETRGK